MYEFASPHPIDEVKLRILQVLSESKTKTQSLGARGLRFDFKTGTLFSIPVQVMLSEIPQGTAVQVTIQEMASERAVDEAFFGESKADDMERERFEEILPLIDRMKASIDGLEMHDLGQHADSLRDLRFLPRCPNCGSSRRKGFNCAYCGTSMILPK